MYDFRWSMSAEEITRLASLTALRSFMISSETKNAETFFHDDIGRIVLYSSNWFSERAMIDWACTMTSQTTNSHAGTVLLVTDKSDLHENSQEHIQDLSRKISQSMKVVCTCLQNVSSFENGTAE